MGLGFSLIPILFTKNADILVGMCADFLSKLRKYVTHAVGQNTSPLRFLVVLMFFRRKNLENSALKVNFFLESGR